ncbi:hypothetical protein EXM22_06650 [Oceanispirochaeta crateris]|uniref:Outer membrane protein beta-barrel domain-containing protein n=1 Tax=Oceanispirochaeta crateris TaxID=2518645 RepID=A0A5C1QND1_9SPIO|nr:hypothetical protein [Oceanispirochaeta crateris]QEN07682.1 hypothetical protein EXM22_06650 [Oceanispirochaeta crateris]
MIKLMRYLHPTVLLFLFLPGTIDSQEINTKLKQIHMGGFSYSQSIKNHEESIGTTSSDLQYSLKSAGLNYGSFRGDRLGFISDINVIFPFSSAYNSQESDKNTGLILDYMGGVGWNLGQKSLVFLPAIGFHGDYSYLSKDPVDENTSNHMFSFGIGIGLKILYKINAQNAIFTGIRGGLDTIEFSSATYDSREIRMKTKWTYIVSAGYALTL